MYTITIQTLGITETYNCFTVNELYDTMNSKLHEMYIAYDKDQFLAKRTLYRHMRNLQIHDFALYKCEKSIIQIHKLPNTEAQKLKKIS